MGAYRPDGFEGLLATLGFTADEERLYLALVARAGASGAELSRATKMSRGQVRELLSGLEARGLASKSADRPNLYVASRPDLALEVLILRREEELEGLRVSAQRLARVYEEALRRTDTTTLVEAVVGREAIGQRYVQLQRGAKREIRSFDKPPYVTGSEPNYLQYELMEKGIRYRTIYDHEALEYPGQVEDLREMVTRGEEARTLAGLPMRLVISDDTAALLPLSLGVPEEEEGDIFVHASPLLEALIMLFEILWERASPIRFAGQRLVSDMEGSTTLSEDEATLLTLLAADLKEEVIAREPGIARRTAQRRIRRLLDRLGAATRVQAVLQAARRGWL